MSFEYFWWRHSLTFNLFWLALFLSFRNHFTVVWKTSFHNFLPNKITSFFLFPSLQSVSFPFVYNPNYSFPFLSLGNSIFFSFLSTFPINCFFVFLDYLIIELYSSSCFTFWNNFFNIFSFLLTFSFAITFYASSSYFSFFFFFYPLSKNYFSSCFMAFTLKWFLHPRSFLSNWIHPPLIAIFFLHLGVVIRQRGWRISKAKALGSKG